MTPSTLLTTPTNPSTPVIIFCDGACSGNPGPGGWGSIVATPDGRVIELGGGERATTNNRMELIATTEGLKAVANVPGDVVVYTDSVYVIKGITQWIWGWRKKDWKTATGTDVANRELWERLSLVVGGRPKPGKLSWKYVRGHTGIPGNERADAIAVAFSKGEPIQLYRGMRDYYLVDLSDVTTEELSDKPKNGTKPARPYSYLSLIGGAVERHASWAECERRVKGKSGAKYKKAASASDEAEILRSWNIDPKRFTR